MKDWPERPNPERGDDDARASCGQVHERGRENGRDNTPPLPGWFGKLPGMGDFAHRRLPAPFREQWDCWLQNGLAGLHARHADDWTAHYLESPLWCFALGPDTIDAKAWIGVLMPSVDGAGRYFPFMLASEFDARVDAAAWWACAAGAALEALEADLDPERFEALLARRFNPAGAPGDAAPPLRGQSLWRAACENGGNLQFALAGLPRDTQFDALFGFVPAAQPYLQDPPP